MMVSVVANTLSATSFVPSSAACIAGLPRSMCLKMFSRTTTASSIKRPIASESASSVIMFSVKPSMYITKNVPITLVGKATALRLHDRLGIPLERSIYLQNYGHIGQVDPLLSLKLARDQKRFKDGDVVVMMTAGIGYVWNAMCLRYREKA